MFLQIRVNRDNFDSVIICFTKEKPLPFLVHRCHVYVPPISHSHNGVVTKQRGKPIPHHYIYIYNMKKIMQFETLDCCIKWSLYRLLGDVEYSFIYLKRAICTF